MNSLIQRILRFSLVAVFLFSTQSTLQSATPAFPGAEGGARYVTGGRGGTVYYVNSLLDTNTGNSTTREGTLRWCLNQSGTKTILFKVSGTIDLTSQLSISKANVTIAGQTAPGDGICLRYYTTYVGTTNVIIRYMRFRLGDTAQQENDAIWGREKSDIMLDHCSMSWCVDECASFYSNKNYTMQWCLLAESLRQSIHDKGAHGYGGIWGGENATFHHNMLVHHDSRNPRFNGWKRSGLDYSSSIAEERLDFRNNVIYNWGSNSVYGGEAAGHYNMVNNYYKYGPATSPKYRIVQAWADASTAYGLPYGQFYMTGNYVYGYPAVTATNSTGIANNTSVSVSSLLVSTPYAFGSVTTHTAEKAFEKVLAYVGCSLKRDTVDGRLVQEAKNGTYTYTGSNGSTNGLIDTQSDVGGWPTLNSTAAPTDTDIDGMPDDWETAHGLNPNSAADGNTFTLSSEGYTNLEIYLNSLVETITNDQNADGTFTTGVETSSIENETLQVLFLNGSLEIRSEKPLQRIRIYAVDGRMQLDRMLSGETEVNGFQPNLYPGLYLLKALNTDGTSSTVRFLIQK
jgi:hypothetical protein